MAGDLDRRPEPRPDTRPALARLADAIVRRDQADIERLQGWLALQGLAPHGHSHQRADELRQMDAWRRAWPATPGRRGRAAAAPPLP